MFAGNSLVLATVLAVIGLANSQVIGSGECSCNVNVIPNFNVQKYLGVWYEYAKYPFFYANGTCISAEYSLLSNGDVGVVNSQKDANGCPSSTTGSASVVENGKLLVKFPESPPPPSPSNYWVLGTDYTSYSVVYSCQPYGLNQHYTMVWILTRSRNPAAATITKARNVLTANGISQDPLVITDQTNCS